MATATPRAATRAKKPKRRPPAADPARALIAERAAQSTLAANPLIGVGRKDLAAAAGALVGRLAQRPAAMSKAYAALARDLALVAAGRSTLEPTAGDRRFADAAWRDNAVYRRLLQSYVALGGALDRCVDDAKLDGRNGERARFAM